MSDRVVLGFSGGVDSAVSALLLKEQGYTVLGVYLDNGTDAQREETQLAAERMNVPLTIVPVKERLEACVCKPFAEAYLAGRTPNPCILCNPLVKFKALMEEAVRKDAPFIATGHYAKAENGAVYKGHPENDQSYMLARITKEQAAHLILPLGPYPKREVREMAEKAGLSAAHKPDSMEICFIPDKDYAGWLSKRAQLPGPGPMYLHGEIAGMHGGICRYTVGQRVPGLFDGRKAYVSRIDPERNAIELALWEELFKTEVIAHSPSFLTDPPEAPFRATVRVRHTKWENPPCTVYPEGETLRIECEEPVRAPAPGQAAALYVEDRLIGGGIIG